ncbi:MAG: hypothetical protein ACRDZX_02370 [Acidimicrobiales bacterium]
MEVSPFPYQGPLEPHQVRGRDDLIEDLVGRVTGRRVTALLGPRRYGKTSALRRVASELTEVTTVWVDLYEVTSLADVAVRLDEGLAATRGPFASTTRALAASVQLNLGLVRVALSGPARQRPDPAGTLHGLLDVLVGTALRRPTLVVIDEFSSIGKVPGASGAFRTALQHHYTDMGVVFAGSHPSMMRALFSSRPEPFYGQADLVEIGPLSGPAIEEVVRSGFASTGRDAGPCPGLVTAFTAGHPQRSMQLADACWRQTPVGRMVSAEGWSAALDEVRATADEGMERIYSGFERGERALLRAVALSGSVYGREAELLDLSTGAATHARQALLDKGDLHYNGPQVEVVDPLFADWLRRRFPI